MKNSPVNMLKLRAGWGVTGQQDGIGDYAYIGNYFEGGPTAQYAFGGQYYTVFRPAGFDANLKWETTKSYNIGLDYGFKNDPDVPGALAQLKTHGCEVTPMTTSYFLSRDSIVPTVGGGMATWREKLFAQMHLNASAAADFLNLPSNSVVELGSKIEI